MSTVSGWIKDIQGFAMLWGLQAQIAKMLATATGWLPAGEEPVDAVVARLCEENAELRAENNELRAKLRAETNENE